MSNFLAQEARVNRTQSGLLDMYFKMGFKVDKRLNDSRIIEEFKNAWAQRRRALKKTTAQSEASSCITKAIYPDSPSIGLSTTVNEILDRCESTLNLRVPQDDILYIIMHDPIDKAVQQLDV
jgi:hypothetical protein